MNEEQLEELLSQVLRLGERQGLERALEAQSRRVLEEETRDATEAIERLGVTLAAVETLKRTFPERWARQLSPILAEIGRSATSKAAPYLGVSFNVKNPKMGEWFRGYVSELADTLSATSYENVTDAIREAMDEGASIPNTVKKLQNRLDDLSTSRAKLIARTESARSANGAALLQYEESGVVSSVTWKATRDSRTRPEHMALDGETVPVGETFSNGLRHPSEPNCRCTILANLDESRI